MNKLLSINNLKVSFQNGDLLTSPVSRVSLSVDKGETVALVGESGSGKSLTAKSILGVLDSWNTDHKARVDGEINFKNKDGSIVDLNQMSDLELDQIRGASIGIIFQEPHSALNPVITIGDQVAEMLIKHRNMKKDDARKRTIELFDLVDLPNPASRFDSYPHQLSGGQLQRVVIAMAISCDPDLLIADEPTTALDVTVQKQILDLLKSLQRDLGMSILIITHDLAVVAEFSDKVYVMYSGNVLESGYTDEVFANPGHPYTSILINSVITLDTTIGKRLFTKDYFISEQGKDPGTVLFDPKNEDYQDLQMIGDDHYVSKMYTKVVE